METKKSIFREHLSTWLQASGSKKKRGEILSYLNHFVASRRIVSKERVGARWKICREKQSLTPYQRALARDDISRDIKTRLRAVHARMNPMLLVREIDRRLGRMFAVYKRYGKPHTLSEFR